MKKYLGYIIFLSFLTSLLSSCDPVGNPYLYVDRVIAHEKTPCVIASQQYSFGIPMIPDHGDILYCSNDHGGTWEINNEGETIIREALTKPVERIMTECIPSKRAYCFRITGKKQVEKTVDGGETWLIDWEVPGDRAIFMSKNPALAGLLQVEPEIIPQNIGVFEENQMFIVVVAMGNQGVLVKSTNGNWTRYPIISPYDKTRSATPFPFYATNFLELLQHLSTDILWILFFTFLFVIFRAKKRKSDENSQENKVILIQTLYFLMGTLTPYLLWGIGIIPWFSGAYWLAFIFGVFVVYKSFSR